MPDKSISQRHQEEERVYHNGIRLLGISVFNNRARPDGMRIYYSPEKMKMFYELLTSILLTGNFHEAREIEQEYALPRTMLNRTIAELIQTNRKNCLAAKLIETFRDRGFGNVWLK